MRGRMNGGFCSHNCADTYRKHNVYKQNPRYEHVCELCGETFKSDNYHQKYCSTECLKAATTGRTTYTKTCPWCGTEFETIDPKQVYCSSACGARHYGMQIRGEYFCEYCGKPRWSDHPNRNRFCSRECFQKHHALKMLPIKLARQAEWERNHNKICVHCGKPYVAGSKTQLFCSAECRSEGLSRYKRLQYEMNFQPRQYFCVECGKQVVTTLGDRRRVFCSDDCAKRWEHRRAKRKRREQMKAAFVEPVSLMKVYDRASGVCEICGLPVPRDTTSENPWGATRDHIIPLSKGGFHMNSNCQLAHRVCNSLKHDSVDEYKVDWSEMLKAQPGRWNELLDNLWEQLGIDASDAEGFLGFEADSDELSDALWEETPDEVLDGVLA